MPAPDPSAWLPAPAALAPCTRQPATVSEWQFLASTPCICRTYIGRHVLLLTPAQWQQLHGVHTPALSLWFSICQAACVSFSCALCSQDSQQQ